MSTIMLDCKKAQQKGGIDHRDRQCQPITYGQRPPGQNPQKEKGTDSYTQFEGTAHRVGLSIFRENPDPVTWRTGFLLFLSCVRVIEHMPTLFTSCAAPLSEECELANAPDKKCRKKLVRLRLATHLFRVRYATKPIGCCSANIRVGSKRPLKCEETTAPGPSHFPAGP